MGKHTSKIITPFLILILVLVGTGESTIWSDPESPEAEVPAGTQHHGVPDIPAAELNEVDIGDSTPPKMPTTLHLTLNEPIDHEADEDETQMLERLRALRMKQLEDERDQPKEMGSSEDSSEDLLVSLKTDATLKATEITKPEESEQVGRHHEGSDGSETPTRNEVSIGTDDATGENVDHAEDTDTKEQILVETATDIDAMMAMNDELELTPRNAFRLFKFITGNVHEMMDRTRRYERVSVVHDGPKVVVVVVPIIMPPPLPAMVRPFPYMYHTSQFLGRNLKTAFPSFNPMLPSFGQQHLDGPMAPAPVETEKTPVPEAAEGEINDAIPAPAPPKEEDRLVDYASALAAKKQKDASEGSESGYFLQ